MTCMQLLAIEYIRLSCIYVIIRVKKHACHSYVHVYLMISTTCVIFEGAGRLLVVKEVHRCSR